MTKNSDLKSYDSYHRNFSKNKIESLEDYIDFCTVEINRKTINADIRLEFNKRLKTYTNLEDIGEIVEYFRSTDEHIKVVKNLRIKDFPLAYLKYKEFNHLKSIYDKVKECYENSGILLNDESLKEFVETLIPYSFAICGLLELQTPYYSADDEKYYIIDNPVLKDKTFKVPMMRGSSWKGIIASAAKKVMESKPDYFINYFLSFSRLFGSGSVEFRELIEIIDKYSKKTKDETDNVIQEKFSKHLKLYAVFNLGKEVKVPSTPEDLETIWNKIKEKALQVQRGRLIFYPTFFNKLGLEMINPHDNKRKAGTNPVHYEVVPAGANGRLQLVYIPAEGISKQIEKLKKEVEDDIDLLTQALKLIFEGQKDENEDEPFIKPIKIGAKTKLGWGSVAAMKAIKLLDRDGYVQVIVPVARNPYKNTEGKNEIK
jgi:CRISPR-associated protein Cmr2